MNFFSIALHSNIQMFHKTSNVSLLGGRTSDWNRAFEILDRYSVLRLSVSRRDLSETLCAGRCVPESFCRPDIEFSAWWFRFVSCRTYFIMHQIGRRRFYLSNIHEMDVNRFYAQTNSCVMICMIRFEQKYRQKIFATRNHPAHFPASRPILKYFHDQSIDRTNLCLVLKLVFGSGAPLRHGRNQPNASFAPGSINVLDVRRSPEDCAAAIQSWTNGQYPCKIFRGRS